MEKDNHQGFSGMASIDEVREGVDDMRTRSPSLKRSEPSHNESGIASDGATHTQTPQGSDKASVPRIHIIPCFYPQFSFNAEETSYCSPIDPKSCLPSALPSPGSISSISTQSSPRKTRRSFAEQLEGALREIESTYARRTARSESRSRLRGRSTRREPEVDGYLLRLQSRRPRSPTMCRACFEIANGSRDLRNLEHSSHRLCCPARLDNALALGFGYTQGEPTLNTSGRYYQVQSRPLGVSGKVN